MKTQIKFSAVSAALLLPLAASASIPRGPQFTNTDVFLLLAVVLLIMSNAMLALINVMWKKGSVRVYNLVVTALMFACGIGLFFVDLKAGAITLFIVLLLGLLIYLSRQSKNNGQ